MQLRHITAENGEPVFPDPKTVGASEYRAIYDLAESVVASDEGESDRAVIELLRSALSELAARSGALSRCLETATVVTPELFCTECAEPCFVDDDGVSFHSSEDSPDGIDHDADADHVAIPEKED